MQNASDNLWKRASVVGKPYENAEVDITPAIQKTIDNIPENVKQLHPEEVRKTADYLQRYAEPLKLSVIEKEISDINAQERGFYNANATEKARMLMDDPALKLKIDFANELRNSFFDEIERQGDPYVKKIRQDWGAISEVKKNFFDNYEKNRRIDAKKNIFSLEFGAPARRGFWVGAIARLMGAHPATAMGAEAAATGYEMLKTHRGKPSQIISRAMDRLAKSSAKPPSYSLPIENFPMEVRGLLTAGSYQMPYGQNIVRVFDKNTYLSQRIRPTG